MASVCDVCGKRPQFGMRLSHSHRRTKRRWNPNVQRVRAIVNGAPRRIHVCTSCLKAGKVQKPGPGASECRASSASTTRSPARVW